MDMAETPRGKTSRPPASGTGNARQEESKRNSQCSDLLILAVSAAAFVADLSTDGLLCAEYWRGGQRCRALATLLLVAAPNLVVQSFSLRWHIADSTSTLYHWASHMCLAGLFHRYIILIKSVISREPSDKLHLEVWRCRLGDLTLLNLFRSFLQSAPQVALQAYFCIVSEQHSNVRAASLAVSLLCLLWAGPAYSQRASTQARRAARLPSLLLKSVWHCCMLMARLAAIVLFAVVFGLWTLVPLGIHWAAMTVWIISHKTEFCPTKLEELFYNIVVGFIYCFCYLNLREGQTRYRLMTFYTLMVTQNLASLFLFMLVSDVARQRKVWAVLATVCIVAGTIIGLCSMLLYYRWFHPGGPIKWKTMSDDDIELNNKNSIPSAERTSVKLAACEGSNGRTLKTGASKPHTTPVASGSMSQEVSPQPDMGNTDKKFLLEHWIARSGTPTFVSAPIGNTSMDVTGVEFYTVENTPQSNISLSTDSVGSKNKKKICSPTELNLKLSSIELMESSIDELTSSNLTLQKRRGICSSDELKEDLEQLDIEEDRRKKEKSQKSVDHGSEISQDTDSSNKKTSSDSIDMDLELSFSDINSSDINEFNENIVQKLCLSTLKNIKVGNQDADIQNIQRIALDILKEMYAKKGKHSKVKARDVLAGSKRDSDTPSEALSVHDYENICAVNIAREAWGLRSWNNYSDIESRRHDGSVGHDPRRDTLTSASSEISSCLSHDLRHQLMSVIAAPPVPRRFAPTYSNVFIKHEPLAPLHYADQHQDDIECYTFLAKPCLIDSATGNHLEPIVEEIDDFGDVEPPSKPRLNSESSLVATIDEIRKGTIANSPRNVYHRRENMWDSPQMNSPPKIETSLKRALWKEPSKFNSSNILESLQEKENNLSESNQSKFSSCKPPASDGTLATAVDHSRKEEYGNKGKNTRRNQKVTNLKSDLKKNIEKGDANHDLSNKDVDFLWQLVSDNMIPLQSTSTEDLAANQITSSLQSLILKDSVMNSGQKSNTKKTARNKPRRKFSLLREHFEPKLANVSDERAIYRHFESKSSPPGCDPVFSMRLQNELSHIPDGVHGEKSSDELNCVPRRVRDPAVASSFLGHCSPRNMKEKRSIFLKQVLSPPKFNTKTKHKA